MIREGGKAAEMEGFAVEGFGGDWVGASGREIGNFGEREKGMRWRGKGDKIGSFWWGRLLLLSSGRCRQ